METHRFSIRCIPHHSEASMRKGYPFDGPSPVWRWRYCSTDTCQTCGAGPGEVCRAHTEMDGGEWHVTPLPYFHVQQR